MKADWVLLDKLKNAYTHTHRKEMICHTYHITAKKKMQQVKRKKPMTNKNGFEIRADVLEMAKDYMDKQMQLNLDYVTKMQEIGKIQAEEYKAAFKPYTVEELMEKAKEFYSFVEKK